MQKVINIIPSLATGGAEKMALDLANGLKQTDWETVLISLYPRQGNIFEEIVDQQNIKTIFLNKKKGLDIFCFFTMWKTLELIKPTVVHTHLHAYKYALPWLMVHRNVKWFHTVHNIAEAELPKRERRLIEVIYKNGRCVPVAISDYIKHSILKEYGCFPNDIPIIFNGIDIRAFPFKAQPKKQEITFCCVARMNKQKNHKILINAFALAVQNIPNLKLLLIGDGELKDDIESQIKECGIEQNVQLIGVTKNVHEYLRQSDAFVLSSNFEGLPISILEAMATGLPIIATAVGGIPNIVSNLENGILIQKGDINALVGAIIKIATDEKLRLRMAEASVNKAKLYDICNMVNEYKELYSR